MWKAANSHGRGQNPSSPRCSPRCLLPWQRPPLSPLPPLSFANVAVPSSLFAATFDKKWKKRRWLHLNVSSLQFVSPLIFLFSFDTVALWVDRSGRVSHPTLILSSQWDRNHTYGQIRSNSAKGCRFLSLLLSSIFFSFFLFLFFSLFLSFFLLNTKCDWCQRCITLSQSQSVVYCLSVTLFPTEPSGLQR